MSYTQVIEIKSDSQNHVESFIHEVVKQSNDAGRYGVEIEVTRVDVADKEVEGFES